MVQHRAEVQKALEQIRDRLLSPEPLDGMACYQLRATAEYALSELRLVEELKRARKTTTAGAS